MTKQKFTEEGLPIMPTSAVAVAAAMVAVVADSPAGYVSTSSGLRDRKWNPESPGERVYSTGCIQGAVLEKLGYYSLENADTVNNGDYDTLMQVLGQVEDFTDYDTRSPEKLRLRDALSIAQSANDSRLPWSAALEGFERVMAGEEVFKVRQLVREAQRGLTTLKNPQREVPDQCPCGCCEMVKKAASAVNPFQPSWYSPIFQKAVDAEMASMKKFIELANQPVGEGQQYVTFPVVGAKNPVSAFKEMSTV